MTGAPLIEVRHVTIVRDLDRAPARPALDVSLSIDAGEHVCIFGPNGCGKSTLIKTITREVYPLAREGSSVRILGRDRWNVFELRAKRGIVTPDLLAACSTDATGRDVVLSGFFSSTMSQLARAGIGVVLVTHHVSEIIPEIDRIVMLEEGRVVADGPKSELLTSERVSELFGVQAHVHRDRDRYWLTTSDQ